MIPVGSIIGGALGVGGSIFGGISASKAMKKARQNIIGQKMENDDWYNRRYNEDVTQRADAQRILTLTQQSIRDRNRAAAGTAAVMGGTEESVAATKAANNEALAEATSQIAAAGERRKEQVEEAYRQKRDQLDAQLNNAEIGKANAMSQAIGGVATAAADMGGSIDEYINGRP